MLMDDKAADQIPDIADIISARSRIQGEIRTTPLLSDPQLNARLGCELWLK
jgi:threonine dehydratase